MRTKLYFISEYFTFEMFFFVKSVMTIDFPVKTMKAIRIYQFIAISCYIKMILFKFKRNDKMNLHTKQKETHGPKEQTYGCREERGGEWGKGVG